MAKFVSTDAIDRALQYIKCGGVNRVTGTGAPAALKMVVMNTTKSTGSPDKFVSLQGASHGWNLASAVLDSLDFVISVGDAGGNSRKIAVGAQSALDVVMSQTTATASEVAICSPTAILLKTTCTAQLLTNGNTVTVPTFDDEIAAAT